MAVLRNQQYRAKAYEDISIWGATFLFKLFIYHSLVYFCVKKLLVCLIILGKIKFHLCIQFYIQYCLILVNAWAHKNEHQTIR